MTSKDFKFFYAPAIKFKTKQMMSKFTFSLTLLMLILSCSVHKSVLPIPAGSVYVFDSLSPDKLKEENWRQELDAIYPILAFRLNRIHRKSIEIKYRFGFEASMNFRAHYKSNCDCFESDIELPLGPRGEQSSLIRLYYTTPESLKITLSIENHKAIYNYRFTYVNSFKYNEESSRYFQENSFHLFSQKDSFK